MYKYILVSCTSTVLMLRGQIPHCTFSSKPPHLQEGAFKLLKIRNACRGVLLLLSLVCSSIYIILITELLLCEVNEHFPPRFAPITSPYVELNK